MASTKCISVDIRFSDSVIRHAVAPKVAGGSKSALRRDVRRPPLFNRFSASHVCCVGRKLQAICFAFSSVLIVLVCSRK